MDNISVFQGIKPSPTHTVSWQEVLKNIQSDKYKDYIEKGRLISDPDKYREYKKKLPAVTFAGEFKHRNKEDIISATGFIVPDLDHLENVNSVFELFKKDPNIWFGFKSPSGSGIKCGIRSQNIKTDEDIKKLYTAVEFYFSQKYELTIDPACKDISRLTFVSYDPDLFINPDPKYFNIGIWTPPQDAAVKISLPENQNNGWKSKYGLKVLESCCEAIKNSSPGNQHWTRLTKARLIGGFIPEFLSESEVFPYLENAVAASGAKNMHQAMQTIKDGLEHGKLSPISVLQNPNRINNFNKNKDIDYYCDPDEVFESHEKGKQSKQSKQESAESAEVSGGKQEVSKSGKKVSSGKQESAENQGNTPQNLAAHIKEWVTNSSGSFTTEQLDREFCLTTRKEKNNRSRVLNKLFINRYINKDKNIKGKYHIISSEIDWVDLDAPAEESYDITLPFDLNNHVIIPPHSIIIIAGSGDAGKTTFILNILKANRWKKYKKIYLMSEMGPGEYKRKIKQFGEPLDKWKCIKAAPRSYDFNGVIEHHNKDGLTCIDYLEEIQGEYFKITSQIRDVYDSLGDGVAVIAIQKDSKQAYARGGEGTMEKSRLYLSIDYLCTVPRGVVCAIKIMKAKNFINDNYKNFELHFKIHGRNEMEILMDWTPSHKVDRDKCRIEYERDKPLPDSSQDEVDPIYFAPMDGGKPFRVREKTIVEWGARFINIEDLYEELLRIAEQHNRKHFVKNFIHLSQIIAKKDKELA